MIALTWGTALLLSLLLIAAGALIGMAAAGETVERIVVAGAGDDSELLARKLKAEEARGRGKGPRAAALRLRLAAKG